MIEITNTEVFGWDAAIRGMRNPMNSWDKSDSVFGAYYAYGAKVGENDLALMKKLIQLLPSSYNQKRTVQLNYAVLRNMYHARRNHKLDEWRDFCSWVESLPYAELITLGGNDNGKD